MYIMHVHVHISMQHNLHIKMSSDLKQVKQDVLLDNCIKIGDRSP